MPIALCTQNSRHEINPKIAFAIQYYTNVEKFKFRIKIVIVIQRCFTLANSLTQFHPSTKSARASEQILSPFFCRRRRRRVCFVPIFVCLSAAVGWCVRQVFNSRFLIDCVCHGTEPSVSLIPAPPPLLLTVRPAHRSPCVLCNSESSVCTSQTFRRRLQLRAAKDPPALGPHRRTLRDATRPLACRTHTGSNTRKQKLRVACGSNSSLVVH